MSVSVTLEFTPNPNTLKFVVNQGLLEKGAVNFTDAAKAENAPLVAKLFGVEGVDAVMVGTNFVTITKGEKGSWDTIAEQVPQTMEAHLGAGEPVFGPEWTFETEGSTGDDSEVVTKIKEVLDNDIRPAVAMDGGDITFDRFEEGVVYLHLQGACASCPSSIATLKMGVENRLKQVCPEVREVVQV